MVRSIKLPRGYTIDRIKWNQATVEEGVICKIWPSIFAIDEIASKKFYGKNAWERARVWAHKQGAED